MFQADAQQNELTFRSTLSDAEKERRNAALFEAMQQLKRRMVNTEDKHQ